ncbi:MAG: hypothetical protein IPO21_10470 [Bacteroidales bacterium]|nr:hypothetical protein [Bacteroidales bacterium]
MTKLIIVFFLILCSFSGISQAIYTGKIQNSNIELQILATDTMNVFAVYLSNLDNTPRLLRGSLKNDSLILCIINTDRTLGDTVFTFTDFKTNYDNINGNYYADTTIKALPIYLMKNGDVDSYPVKDSVFEILQAESSKDQYFKILFSHNHSFIPGINIYNKKSNALIQTIQSYYYYREFFVVSVEDYNFDKVEDFSVFESYYAGANTSSIYYLRNKKNNQYTESGFTGTSLQFDARSKTITEYNQCCAGKYISKSIYKVKKNEMVLIEKNCFEFDEELNKHIEGACHD